MAQSVKTSHPKSTFCFYVSGRHLGDDVLNQMRTVITRLSENRTWVIGPPTLADENDGEVRMIGGTLDLYTAIPPFGADLPKDVHRQHLEEVTEIVDALTLFSQRTDREISFRGEKVSGLFVPPSAPDTLLSWEDQSERMKQAASIMP